MDLRLKLDDIDFDRLVETGRAMIPGLSRDWTDHNIHDPGIMLIELLAYQAEAQIFALSTLRHDERQAYARLLGIEPRRPQPAEGTIWPSDPALAHLTAASGALIEGGTIVVADYPGAPRFVTDLRTAVDPKRTQFLTPARLVRLETQFADGRRADHTRVNGPNGATFLPFGPVPAAGDSLILGFDGDLRIPNAEDVVLTLGVEAEASSGAATAEPAAAALRVALRDDNGDQDLTVLGDTSEGMLRSGVLTLSRPNRPQLGPFQLVIRGAGDGLMRPARIRRIGINVVPVIQRQRIEPVEVVAGKGLPDETHKLEKSAWIPDPSFLVVEPQLNGNKPVVWQQVADFGSSLPDDRHFVFDPAEGILLFGNGINGAVLPANTQLTADYFVCAGASGDLPAGIGWSIVGLPDTYGLNGEGCAGGRDADTLETLQSRAIEQLAAREPYVTRSDIAAAAVGLPHLGVARALELVPDASRNPRGTRILLVVADRDREAPAAPESRGWLEAIRTRLAPRVPLGQRLAVIAPRFVDVAVTAQLTVKRTADVDAVRAAAESRLQTNLAPVDRQAPGGGWAFGRDVTATTIKAWLRGIDGVSRVGEVKVAAAGAAPADRIALKATELPNYVRAGSIISIARAGEAQR